MLALRGVSVRYDTTVALDAVDLDVDTAEVLCVLGPSGSGKTTLLRAIAGLEPLATGTIRRDGHDLSRVPPHRRGVGLMFQDHALFPHRNVLANVAFGPRVRGQRHPLERAREALTLVGLAGFETRRVHELSGGEQQRVALARALAPDPAVLMLDEPLGSLDRELRERLAAELRELFTRLALSVVFVTHDHDEAFALADRIAILHAGRVEQVDSPGALWRRPNSAVVARFLGWDVTDAFGERAAVRPGGVHIADAGITGCGVKGTVTARTFRRDHYLVAVRLDDDSTLHVGVEPDRLPEPGKRVVVTADDDALVALSHHPPRL